MKNKELIKLLEQQDPESEVVIVNRNDHHFEVIGLKTTNETYFGHSHSQLEEQGNFIVIISK